MHFVKRLWNDIQHGQNLDIYITALVALVIAVFGVVGIASQNLISAAILAVLALLLSSLLTARHQNDKLQATLLKLEAVQSSTGQIMTTGDDISELLQLLRQSKQAYFWGTTFTTHIPLLQQDLERGIALGLEIRFILIKPSGDALKMAAFRAKDLTPDELNDDLLRNLRRLDNMANLKAAGKLEFKVIDYLAPYVMYVFDPHLPTGQILMRLSTLRVPEVMRPIIRITRKSDPDWFDFFVQQFETAWNSAVRP